MGSSASRDVEDKIEGCVLCHVSGPCTLEGFSRHRPYLSRLFDLLGSHLRKLLWLLLALSFQGWHPDCQQGQGSEHRNLVCKTVSKICSKHVLNQMTNIKQIYVYLSTHITDPNKKWKQLNRGGKLAGLKKLNLLTLKCLNSLWIL